jgi:SET domain-containing protein
MYTQYIKTMPSKIGNGTFTTIDIPAGVPILECTGDLFNKTNIPDHPAVLQIAGNSFLGPSGKPDDTVNHSCDPNCYLHIVGLRAILYSLYFIKAGSELTFDYSTTSTDTLDEWKMNCECGAFKCRKIISGFQYLDPQLQADYKKRGMIPLFLTHDIFIKE